MSTVSVKIEPPDSADAYVTPSNMSSAALTNGERHDVTSVGSDGSSGSPDQTNGDTKNFTCLLCDVICCSREVLRKHLKNVHASKHYNTSNFFNSASTETALQAFSGYMNYRYTCTICHAKFKSFRTYLTHSMSHRGVRSMGSTFDEARMTALFGSGKQYMQDYFVEADEGLGSTFSCDECKTVFMQRDAYAMHMMMRAMNETCKSDNPAFVINNNEGEEDGGKHKDDEEMSHSDDPVTHGNVVGESTNQRCLEEVTSNIDQDEYLQSVLDKVCSAASTNTKPERQLYARDDQKLCSFCGDGFSDQDNLAMHVMSVHAEEMSSNSSHRASNVPIAHAPAQNPKPESYLSWMAAAAAAQPSMTAMTYLCKYCNSAFMTRDSLAMHVLTHAHLEEKLSAHVQGHKRKFDSIDMEQVARIHRNAELNAKSNTTNDIGNSVQTMPLPSRVKSPANLFCDTCAIRFYAQSEYDWHMKKHTEGNASLYTHTKDIQTQNVDGDPVGHDNTSDGNPSNDEPHQQNNSTERTGELYPIRIRRNSTSSCPTKDLNLSVDALPKRPVSVGGCYSDGVRNRQNGKNGYMRAHGDNGGKSPSDVKTPQPSLETVLSNVRALSSNEQRIIYSVFGSDLSLKVSKPTEANRPSSTTSETNEYSTRVSEASLSPTPSNGHVRARHASMTSSVFGGVTKHEEPEERQNHVTRLKDAPTCRYCEIVFFNKAIYYLHMGLHNVNNPWQCNVCGKICNDAVDFAAHVIHM